jgi:hypothetical protein
MKALLQDVVPALEPLVIQTGSASGIDLDLFAPHGFNSQDWRSTLGLVETDFVVV